MSILMQSRWSRSFLGAFSARRPLGYMGFRRIADHTKCEKAEQSLRVEKIVPKLTQGAQTSERQDCPPLLNRKYASLSPYESSSGEVTKKPNCRLANCERFILEALTSPVIFNPEPVEKWDAPVYD